MSLDSERMKALVAFKKKLEKKAEELDAEMKEVTATLDAVNSVLLEKGFKRGDIKEVPTEPKEGAPPMAETAAPLPQESDNVIPLKTVNDELLAIIYVDKDSLHILPEESKKFTINTPPFNHFFVERILAKMKEKDKELVASGQLAPDQTMAYEIFKEGDTIREIVIRNVDEERLRELKSSIRWTLEKMYEKMKS